MKYYRQDIPYTSMTRAEEIELFDKYYRGRSKKARDRIIFNHLRLAVLLAMRQAPKRSLPEDEAVSAANAGLMRAITSKRFNPRNKGGVRFAAYAQKFIRGEVLRVFDRRRSFIGPADEDPTQIRLPDNEQVDGGFFEEVCERDRKEVLRRCIEKVLPRFNEKDQDLIRAVMAGRTPADHAKEKKVSRQAVSQRFLERVAPRMRELLSTLPEFKEVQCELGF